MTNHLGKEGLRLAARLAAGLVLVAALAPAVAAEQLMDERRDAVEEAFRVPLLVAEALHARGALDDEGLDAARDLATPGAGIAERQAAADRLAVAFARVDAAALTLDDVRDVQAIAEREARALVLDSPDAPASRLPCKLACVDELQKCLGVDGSMGCSVECHGQDIIEQILCLLKCILKCILDFVTCILRCITGGEHDRTGAAAPPGVSCAAA